ncbi:hypothetical protein KEM54_000014 [Ascosphaera aggregata]|nr:hypothetical protein KEM54_000014 [Ascosphaera aggregata]
MPSKEIGDSDGIVGVAVTNNERETDRKPTYIRRPQALRRATLSSAAVLEVNNRASSSKSMIDAEYGHSVDTAEKNHRGISPAGSLGVWREEEPSLPDLRPRSVSVAAIREAARHVRRASDDALISRINARDVSPFPLLPNQVGGMNHASECCDTATTDSGDEAKHVSALHSFYFGAYQRDDASGIGQRVATIEVKLMDLELAISRLQVNLAKNLPSATSVPTRRPPSPPTEVAVVGANPRKRDSSQHLSPYIAEQFFKSPTPTSMGSPNRSTEEHPNSALANPIDRFVREETLALPCRHPEHKLFAPHPSSITGLDRTVYSRALEQFNDPVNMVRQEREARKALEAQVFALQRQVARLMSLGISSSACSQE